MKYCTHCGAELLDEAVLCPKCGCWVNKEMTSTTREIKQTVKTNVCALVGFILSMVSLMFFFNIFGIISIAGVTLSSIGLSECSRDVNYKGRGFAIAGLVVSACMFVFSLIFWLAML